MPIAHLAIDASSTMKTKTKHKKARAKPTRWEMNETHNFPVCTHKRREREGPMKRMSDRRLNGSRESTYLSEYMERKSPKPKEIKYALKTTVVGRCVPWRMAPKTSTA